MLRLFVSRVVRMFLRTFYQFRLRRDDAIGSPAAVELEASEPAPRPPDRSAGRNRVEEPGTTRWDFRHGLLDRLDEYFACVRRVRVCDPDSYALFSRVGLTVSPDVFTNPDYEEHRRFIWRRAAFGGCLFHYDKGRVGQHIYVSFVYFHKVSNPSGVQWAGGDVYALTLVYDDRGSKRDQWRSAGVELGVCHIAVGADGSMRLLKEAVVVSREVRPCDKRGRRSRDVIQVKTIQWRFPAWMHDHDASGKRPEEWAPGVLRMVAGTCESAAAKVSVRVNRAGCVAVFGIDVRRARRFFADRDVTALAADGRRKRIFHHVKAHDRTLTKGVVGVRDHYRGMQDFSWQSYDVHIVSPHLDLTTLTAPSRYTDDIPDRERSQFLDTDRAGELLADVLETSLHG